MACKLLISDLAPAGQIDSRRILQEQGCLDKKAKYTAVHPNEIAGLELRGWRVKVGWGRGCGSGSENVNDWKVGMGIGWEEELGEGEEEEECMHRRHHGRTKKEKE